MKKIVIGTVLVCVAAVAAPWTKGPAANRPALFKTFGDIVNTPEGLALDKDGNLYLSAINGVDSSYSGHIWKRCAQTGKWSVFAVTRTNTKSGKSFPQGIVFGDDGHLRQPQLRLHRAAHRDQGRRAATLRNGGRARDAPERTPLA